MKIYLNIYDLAKANYYLHSLGFGIYHTGIQIGSAEYHFGGHEGSSTGVCQTEPKEYTSNVIFRDSIYLGECNLSYNQVNSILEELKRDFVGNSYDVLTRNCNHFSNAVCQRLLNKSIPSYINRIAYVGNMFRCCIPSALVAGPGSDPTRQDNNYSSKSGSSKQLPPDSENIAFKAFKGNGVSIGGASKSSSKNSRQGYIQQHDIEN
ncbi:hypothetical protein ABPG74_008420 [Tetrahymena malaccensis]